VDIFLGGSEWDIAWLFPQGVCNLMGCPCVYSATQRLHSCGTRSVAPIYRTGVPLDYIHPVAFSATKMTVKVIHLMSEMVLLVLCERYISSILLAKHNLAPRFSGATSLTHI